MPYKVTVTRLDGNPENLSFAFDDPTPKKGELIRVGYGHDVVSAIIEDVHKMGGMDWVIAKERKVE